MQSLKIFRNLIIKLKERAWEVESPVQNNFFGDDEFIKSFEWRNTRNKRQFYQQHNQHHRNWPGDVLMECNVM